jgi:hypothetical protein
MPEMQFFEMPDAINTGDVAAVSFLKAEASGGVLHDILGRHQTLRRRTSSAIRLYIDAAPQNISDSDKNLYLAFQNTSTGAMTEYSQGIGTSFGGNKEWDRTSGVPTSTNPSYYEIYIYDKLGKKIILSSGYTGGTT